MQSPPVSKPNLIKVSFRILLIFFNFSELWGRYAQWNFKLVPEIQRQSPLSDPITLSALNLGQLASIQVCHMSVTLDLSGNSSC